MSELKLCRICLRGDGVLYNISANGFQLKLYYEEITGLQSEENECIMPRYFCYDCAYLLQKFHKFREKCYRGQETIKASLWMGRIHMDSFSEANRINKNLISPLRLTTVLIVSCHPNDDSITEKEIKLEYDVESVDITEAETNLADDSDEKDTEEKDPVAICPEDPIDGKMIKCEPVAIVVEKEEIKEKVDIVKKEESQQDTVKPEKRKLPVRLKKSVVKRKEGVKKSDKVEDKEKPIIKKNTKCKLNVKKKEKKFPGSNWKVHLLSEDDAMKQFNERMVDPKYVKAAFKCTDCYKGFSSEDIYKRHRLLNHDESLGSLECRFCRMRFNRAYQLKRHMTQHTQRYECLRCHLICSIQGSAFQHDQYHNGKISKCSICDEEFQFRSSYYSHLRTAHRSEILCTDCGEAFVSQSGLQKHRRIKHINNTDETGEKEDNAVEEFYCDTCDMKFKNKTAYDHHFVRSMKHNSEEELRATKRRMLGNGRDCRKRKPTTCHQCGKQFKCFMDCMSHHTKEHPRTTFFTQRHICEICGVSLAMSSITAHMNNHTRERIYKCHTCDKQFSAKISLDRHLVTHTGEKPFACTVCDKRFTQGGSVKLHYRTVHLKQPHPKRNRSKKKPPHTSMQAEGSSSLVWKQPNSPPTSESSMEQTPAQQFYLMQKYP